MELIQLLVVLFAAWVLAKLCKMAKLPPILGMIVAGVAAGNLLLPHMGPGYLFDLDALSSPIRLAVLAVILLRAGLGLTLRELGSVGGLALGLGLVPMLGDALMVTIGGVVLLGLPVGVALMLGFLVAAISPAIVIPGMLRLLSSRSGAARRIPMALLAGAPLDNIAAVVAFGITLDIALQTDRSWVVSLALVPYSVVVGALIGVVGGLATGRLVSWLRARRALCVGIVWLVACALIPLCQLAGTSFVIAILTLGITIHTRHSDCTRALTEGFTQVWSVAQYALFALIGAALDLGPLAEVGLVAVLVILLGQLGRLVGVFISTIRQSIMLRERVACVLCYLPKATIQAAFAAVPLEQGLPHGAVLLSVSVLAIVMMAPIGVVTLNRGAEALFPHQTELFGVRHIQPSQETKHVKLLQE